VIENDGPAADARVGLMLIEGQGRVLCEKPRSIQQENNATTASRDEPLWL
jgi:hypothetical protein